MASFNVTEFFHQSPIMRLGARGIVFALVADLLLVLARRAEPQLSTTSLPMTITVVTAFVFVEAALFVFVQTLFKRVS
jgi:type III secretory pathway component EscT